VRTLIVSDLHLGQRPGHDVLRLDEPRRRLLDALDGVQRLVLLGDIVELAWRRHGADPMRLAAPVLGEVAERMRDGEIVLVPGNHDVRMVRRWALARGRELGLADEVPIGATPQLRAVCELLSAAPVRVEYPGTWVRDDVWATHGHYLDRHLLPESTFGLPRGLLARTARSRPRLSPADYELSRHRHARSIGPWAQLLERPLATVLEHLAELTRYGSHLVRDVRLRPFTWRMLDLQVRLAAVPAVAHVATRLGVDARWVVFGHVHRAGPLDGERWEPVTGGPAIVNTGSWVYEPLLLDRSSPPHPYWPGTAVLVEDDGSPQVLRLLDGFPGARLSTKAQ